MGRQESMLGVLWRQEVRHLLRDRRAIFAALLLPLLVLPLLLVIARLAEVARSERVEEEPLRIVVSGAAAQQVRELLPTPSDDGSWRWVAHPAPLVGLASAEVDLVVDGRWTTPSADDGSTRTPRIQLLFRADYERSNRALQELQGLLSAAREETRTTLLAEAGFRLDPALIVQTSEADVASTGQVVGSQIGRWITAAILVFLLLGGSVVAGDTLAGERERGTLETLLTSAVDRRQIVVAKLLAILTFGVLVAVVQLVNLYVHLTWGWIKVPVAFDADLSLGRLMLLAGLLLPLLATASGVLLWISGRADSYKEFHFYLLPASVALLLPTLAAALPGASLDTGWALLPVANLSLAIRAVLAGHVPWISVGIAWAVSTLLALWVVRRTLNELSGESRLVGSRQAVDDAVLEPFERQVGGWFVAFWVIIFLALVHLPLFSGLVPQVLLSLVGICLGGSWLLIKIYRLPVRQTLGLRPPPRAYWPWVLLAVPSLALVNGVVYRWTSELFPVSRRALESYGAFFDGGQLSFLEVLAVAAVLPAITEEIAFRGVLLSGLRRRLPAAQLCCVVGGVFALFHFDLGRFLPTLLLGIALAAVTLRSGSIYPAMVWHGLNNGGVLWLGSLGISMTHLDAIWYVGGVAALALCGRALWLRLPDGRRRDGV